MKLTFINQIISFVKSVKFVFMMNSSFITMRNMKDFRLMCHVDLNAREYVEIYPKRQQNLYQ